MTMKSYTIIIQISFILFCFQSSLLAQEKEIFIKAGRLYESKTNAFVENKWIHVQGSKINSVEDFKEAPDDVEFIDLSDYTVLPGLIDAHTHVLFSQEASEDFAEHSVKSLMMETDALRALRGFKRAKSYLDVGITSIKDLGNSGLFLDVALRDAIEEGTVAGPRIFASGPIMGAAGGQIYGVSPQHQDLIDLEYRIIKSVDDAKNAVREHVNQNVDLIKICADNLPNNTVLSVEEMKAIVQTAHSHKLTVTAHCVTNASAWNAVEAGVDGIEHGFNIADSTLAKMAEKDIFLVPTENSRAYMNTYAQLLGYSTGEELPWINKYLEAMKNRLSKAIELNVPIVAGSDNYTDIGTTRGQSSQDMFKTYYEAGMSPLDILQSATYISAVHLNKENEIGQLIPDAYADIIAVKGNLSKDFVNSIETIVFVMKGGKVYLDNTN